MKAKSIGEPSALYISVGSPLPSSTAAFSAAICVGISVLSAR